MALVFFFLFVYITWSRLHCRFLPPICICFVCVSQSDREEEEKEHLLLTFASFRFVGLGSARLSYSPYIYIRLRGAVSRGLGPLGQPSMTLDNVENTRVCLVSQCFGRRTSRFVAGPCVEFSVVWLVAARYIWLLCSMLLKPLRNKAVSAYGLSLGICLYVHDSIVKFQIAVSEELAHMVP